MMYLSAYRSASMQCLCFQYLALHALFYGVVHLGLSYGTSELAYSLLPFLVLRTVFLLEFLNCNISHSVTNV